MNWKLLFKPTEQKIWWLIAIIIVLTLTGIFVPFVGLFTYKIVLAGCLTSIDGLTHCKEGISQYFINWIFILYILVIYFIISFIFYKKEQ